MAKRTLKFMSSSENDQPIEDAEVEQTEAVEEVPAPEAEPTVEEPAADPAPEPEEKAEIIERSIPGKGGVYVSIGGGRVKKL